MRAVPHRAGPARSLPGLKAVEHRFEVPLRHGDPSGEAIEVFARELRAAAAAGDMRPHLLMLNGGPGHPAMRPTKPGAWLKRALEDYHVLLLDQRGTGLSTPQDAQTLAGLEPPAQAERLTHFRTDAIVGDAERIRHTLLEGERWSVLGQSFGGFAAVTYLSLAPEGLGEVLVTGGLPPLDLPADDVYRATFARLEHHIARYLDRYDGDRERWQEVLDHAGAAGERFPNGRPVTGRRLKALGIELGMSNGPEQLHYLVERAFARPGELSAYFLHDAQARLSLHANPLYAVLHEPIYAQGQATRWAAERVLAEREEPLFHGEMMFRWTFEDDPALEALRDAADLLAETADWPRLYDPERLASNEVPTVAAVYLDDMYVESSYSLETAERIGSLRVWATNEHHHDGIHVGPVLDRLLTMRRGEA